MAEAAADAGVPPRALPAALQGARDAVERGELVRGSAVEQGPGTGRVECGSAARRLSARACKTCLLQGASLGSFSCDGSMQGIHVPAVKLFPLQGIKWLGLIFLMGLTGVASTVYPVGAREAGRATRPIDHQNLRRRITAVALGCSLYEASR